MERTKEMIFKRFHRGLAAIALLSLLAACAGTRTGSAGKVDSGEPPQRPPVLASLSDRHLFSADDDRSDDYRLGSEDEVEVLVWKNADLSRIVSVRPDGKISLPLLGELQAAGLTPEELREAVTERLKEYKETPEVSVIVKGINSLSVFVMGEVVQPGKIQLRSETTLLQAITQAGGFTKFADRDNIVLLRRAGGQEVRMQLNYNNIVKGKSADKNVLLQRGDTIVVP